MRAELMTIVVSQVDICARPLNWSTCVKAGAKRLEPYLLRRQRCSDAAGWLHLDYFRVATIWPEQLQENIRKPTELICPVIRRHQVVGIVPPSII